MSTPTDIAVYVDEEEYSRFETDKDTITVTIVPTGTTMAGEQVVIELFKARRARDEVAATKLITLINDDPITTTLYLPDIVDENEASKVRRGSYFIKGTSYTNNAVFGITDDFLVSIITIEEFRKRYLHGADQSATNLLEVKEQPSKITGVTVINISPGHQLGWFPLTYSYTESDPPGNPIRLLSWCGGPEVKITLGKTRYILRKGNTNEYIEVKIPSISTLPDASTSEDLLIERAPLGDTKIRSIIEEAISWLEDSELAIYLEPTRIVTEIDPVTISYEVGTDIPTFSQATWDKQVDALTYYSASAGHWMNVRFPYYPIISFNEIYGKVANIRIVDIALEWVEFHGKYGFVELVPLSQDTAFNFLGLIWVEALRGPVPIPNFWNFDALVGYKKVPAVLLELIAKKAAIDTLILIGQSLRPGIGSTSISRDGISESVSYLNTAKFGMFTPVITAYQDWIDSQIIKLRGAFRGPNLQVV